MNNHFRDSRKIDPSRGTVTGDNTPNDQDRIEIGPTQLAYAEWANAGLALPDLQEMRRYRWTRLTQAIQARGYAGLLLFDPLNIRYATDSTNMQLWNTHNPFRAVLLCADGYVVIWDYKNAPFLSQFNPLVREVRSGADLFYFDRGDKIDVAADQFSNEVRILIEEHAGQNHRLAVDKIMIHGLHDCGHWRRHDRGRGSVSRGHCRGAIHPSWRRSLRRGDSGIREKEIQPQRRSCHV